jgi:hypothetical protein
MVALNPDEGIPARIARLFQALHTPFALLRLYRQTTGRFLPSPSNLARRRSGAAQLRRACIYTRATYPMEARETSSFGAEGPAAAGHIAFEWRM